MAAAVELRGVSVKYGAVTALDSASLEVERGELFFLLGPSGCGKTTLLRAIAGFVKPDSGDILIDGKLVLDLPPYARNTGMVFQNYALWPHMTVGENVAYGLRVRQIDGEETLRRVTKVLAMVGLSGYEDRKPAELSGGQQQRVALARALVIEPRVVLLDEPLSNLDAKLRAEMRHDLRALIKLAGLTAVYVTHDQAEALSMADRVAVMRDGRVLQVDSPRRLYDAPGCEFVGSFLGEANVIDGTVEELTRDSLKLSSALGSVRLLDGPRLPEGTAVRLLFRPQDVLTDAGDGKGLAFEATLESSSYSGDSETWKVLVGESLRLTMRVAPSARPAKEGKALKLYVAREALRVFGPEGVPAASEGRSSGSANGS